MEIHTWPKGFGPNGYWTGFSIGTYAFGVAVAIVGLVTGNLPLALGSMSWMIAASAVFGIKAARASRLLEEHRSDDAGQTDDAEQEADGYKGIARLMSHADVLVHYPSGSAGTGRVTLSVRRLLQLLARPFRSARRESEDLLAFVQRLEDRCRPWEDALAEGIARSEKARVESREHPGRGA